MSLKKENIPLYIVSVNQNIQRLLYTLKNIFIWSVIINNNLTMDSYLVSHHITFWSTGTVKTISFQCMGCMPVLSSSVYLNGPMCISNFMNLTWYIVTYFVEVKWIRDMRNIDENIVFMKLRVFGEPVRRVWILCAHSRIANVDLRFRR